MQNGKQLLGNLKVNVRKSWNKNGQIILACVAAGSAIAAVVSAVKAGPEAARIQEARKVELERLAAEKEEATKAGTYDEKKYKKDRLFVNIETGKAYTFAFAPTAGFLLLCLGSIGGVYKISAAKYATVLGALKTLQSKDAELEKKMREVIGNKKVDNIKKLIVSDHINDSDLPEGMEFPKEEDWERDRQGNVIAKNYPTPCFFDNLMGISESDNNGYFQATRSQIEKAIIKLSQRLLNGYYEYVTDSMIIKEIDPDGRWISPNKYTNEYGVTVDDLIYENDYGCKVIPFTFTSQIKEGYEHPVLVLMVDSKYLSIK